MLVGVGEAALLVLAAAVGGALNAVAGGGSFFTFPALVFVGVMPIPANATSALALWPGSVASAFAYRHDLAPQKDRLIPFAIASVAGGAAGALLLVFTPSSAFEKLIPFLLLLATILFAAGPKITARVRRRVGGEASLSLRGAVVVQLAISLYGGYFGGGMGMMMLAAFALMGMEDIHRMNGLKALLAVGINAAAIITFVLGGIVVWSHGLLMTAGAMAGGYAGAALARRIKQAYVRWFISVTGVGLSAVFFHRAFF